MLLSHTHGRHHQSISVHVPGFTLQLRLHTVHGEPLPFDRHCYVKKSYLLPHPRSLSKADQHTLLKHMKKYFISVLIEEKGLTYHVDILLHACPYQKYCCFPPPPSFLFIYEEHLNSFPKDPTELFSKEVYFTYKISKYRFSSYL